jgi:DNA-binding MarR family transcriptional regulator
VISEREFEIINIIASNATTTQRQLAADTHMSVGLINILLKRLVLKGFLRARQLDRKKVEYLLTPRGIVEKAQKSYRYTLKTIESFDILRLRISSIVQKMTGNGFRAIAVVGRGPLAVFTMLVLKDQSTDQWQIQTVDRLPAEPRRDILWLDASTDALNQINTSSNVVNLLHVLSSSKQEIVA